MFENDRPLDLHQGLQRRIDREQEREEHGAAILPDMTRAMLLALVLSACATVSSTLMDAHSASLKTQASTDLNCPKEEVAVSSSADDHWSAQGCGKRKDYVLKNPNCVVERDCVWG